MADKRKHEEDWHDEDEEEKEETLATAGVIDKYQEAGKIANSITTIQKFIFKIYLGVLEKVIAKCIPDANISELCAFGDKEIEEQVFTSLTSSKTLFFSKI